MSEPADQGFGDRLRRLRASRGLTQRDLAERAGISKRSLEMYEAGKVPRKAIPQLARALGVSPHYLLHGVDPLEERIEILADRLDVLTKRLDDVQELLAQTAEETRRMFVSLDAIVRLLLAHVAPNVLADLGMPPPPLGEVDDRTTPEDEGNPTSEKLGGVCR